MAARELISADEGSIDFVGNFVAIERDYLFELEVIDDRFDLCFRACVWKQRGDCSCEFDAGFWLRISSLLQIGNDRIYLRAIFNVCCRRLSRTISVRAKKISLLVEHDPNLFFQGHASEERIEGLATDDAICVVVRAAVGEGNEMFDARVGFRQRQFAKEAVPALGKKQAAHRCRWHDNILIGRNGWFLVQAGQRLVKRNCDVCRRRK